MFCKCFCVCEVFIFCRDIIHAQQEKEDRLLGLNLTEEILNNLQ